MRIPPLARPPRAIRPAVLAVLGWMVGVGPMAPAVASAAPERIDLETSDGVGLATWLYTPPEDARPLATVILVHDLEGSHETVEPLAVALQEAGCAVAVPDLRGHGASNRQAGRDSALDIRQFRKADIEAMAAGAGGRLRTQSAVRGDLETVHAFLASKAPTGTSRLAVVGCGAGATIAALWTAADWAWPPLASGPQGQQVQALVLVSPIWTAKGVSLQPALGSDAIRREVPVMLLAGKGDRETVRLFEQLKRQRPREWFDQRAETAFTTAKEVKKPGDARLFLMQLDTALAGEKLASEADAAQRIVTFLGLALDGGPSR